MANAQEELMRRLSFLVGLDVSGIGHAGDMLTFQFGPLREVTTRRGTLKRLGTWALHVQCNWRVERQGSIVANQSDLRGPNDDANQTTERLKELLVTPSPAVVESVWANATGSAWITLSKGMNIVITPNGTVDEEDWRLFAPGSSANHFVIEGGRIDPDSLA